MKIRTMAGCLCGLPLAVALMFSSPAALAQQSATRAEAKAAVTQKEALDFPVVTLQHWKDGSKDARYGFLIGFTSAIEMEKQWQGKKPLKLEQSLINTWVRGFDGVTLKNIYDNIESYIQANPDNMQLSLVEYLWYVYAQPQVNEKVSRKKLESLEYKAEERPLKNIKPVQKGGN
ncbi:hypothetical protein LJC19_06525 [Oxalobacter sp. OttesenSCG-928-P03]|nr:hypothetical protein [Oxalobacter sp. OttesenSCG-928-P03]